MQGKETRVIRFKRRWIPPGSIREKIWDRLTPIYRFLRRNYRLRFPIYRFLFQIYRLYRRDGWRGVWRYSLIRLRGGKPMAPAWWYSFIQDQGEVDKWDRFLYELSTHSYKGMVVFYAGVPFIDTQPLRTVWLARTFIKFGYRVLFVYWRWKPTEIIPQIKNFPEIHQIPMDVFWNFASEILGDERLQNKEKIFFAEFPHPSLFKIMNLANGFGWATIAEQKDDWEEFHKVGQASWYDSKFETYLFHNADLLIATAQNLADKMRKKVEKPIYLIPNAYDPDSLNLEQDTRILVEGDVTLGYFGQLTPAWFDWELVINLMSRHPNWQLYLIGRGEPPRKLSENIHMLGVKPHDELAGYAKNWDIAIIPFKVSELSRGVDPLKIYEYLAIGLPVVISGMPHLANIPGVRNSNSPEGFEEAFLNTLSSSPDLEAIRKYLEAQTWIKRAEKILTLVSEQISAKAFNG